MTRQMGYSSARSMRRCNEVLAPSVGGILAFDAQQVAEPAERADRHTGSFELAAQAMDVDLDGRIRDFIARRVDVPEHFRLADEAPATIPENFEHFVLAP